MSDVNQPENPEKDELAQRLRVLREHLGLTLSQASEATRQIDPRGEGVSKVSISRYENGGSFPGYRELRLLAQTYGVAVSFLFYGDRPDPFAGWEFSLDQFLSDLIDDRLITHGLIPGESKHEREMRKMLAMGAISRRRGPLSQPEDDEPQPLGLDDPALEELAKRVDEEVKLSKSRKVSGKS